MSLFFCLNLPRVTIMHWFLPRVMVYVCFPHHLSHHHLRDIVVGCTFISSLSRKQATSTNHQPLPLMTMTLLVVVRILVAVTTMVCRAWSFSPITTNYNHPIIHLSLPSTTSSSRLFSLIKGEAYGSEPFDENEGGVGLAKRCAVKIVGGRSVGGNAIEAQELYRYERLTPLDKSETANSIAEENTVTFNYYVLEWGRRITLIPDRPIESKTK